MGDYDLILVGGSGAQFGHAVLDGVGMGLLDAPSGLYVVDADRGYLDSTLKPLFTKNVETPFKANPVGRMPTLEFVPPYQHAGGGDFTLLDLMGTSPEALSDLGRLCLTHEEATWNISKGLFGMAKVGGVLMGLAGADSFPSTIIRRLEQSGGGMAPIVLAGSIAGGTGAGFLLPLVRAIRQSPALSSRPVYAFLLLPWFDLPTQANVVGPSNARMRRNASQGALFAARLSEDHLLTDCQSSTYLVLLGLPQGTRPPARDGGQQTSEPSPLLYYGASLLSGDFSAIRAQETNFGGARRSVVLSARCHPSNPGGQDQPFAGLVKYTLDGGGTVTFDSVDALLSAQIRALQVLGEDKRYDGAFGVILDNPDFLPRSLYRSLARGRNTRATRVEAGKKIAERCRAAAEMLGQQRDRLRSFITNASQSGKAGETPRVEAWWEKNLQNVEKLDGALVTGGAPPEVLANHLGQGRIDAAAELVVRSLCRGLARAPGVEKLSEGLTAKAGQALALPFEARADVNDGRALVELSAQRVTELAQALVRGDKPDSQCIPSPLARAHLEEFYCDAAGPQIDSNLVSSHEGRILLMLAGLASGHLRISQRVLLREGFKASDPFERIVLKQEGTRGPRPVRTQWVGLVKSEDRLFAATSPRTGVFPGVRVDETKQDSVEPDLVKLAAQLRADGQLEQARYALRVFLTDVLATYPDAATMPWAKLLSLWTAGISDTEARRSFAENAMYGIGPIELQVGGAGEQAQHDTFWLPRLISRAERERMASAFASAFAVAPGMIDAEINDGIVTVRARTVTPGQLPLVIAKIRAFGASGHALSPKEDLLAGAADFIEGYRSASPIVGNLIQHQWSTARTLARAQLGSSHSNLRRLSPGVLLRRAAENGSVLGKLLNVDAARASILDVEPGPRAPAIVNLYADLPLN